MGIFKIKKKTAIDEMSELEESDFSFMGNDNVFYQYSYHPDKDEDKLEITPGIYSMQVEVGEIVHKPTEFNIAKNILGDYVHTKDLGEKIDAFFDKLNIYEKYGVFPKRGILMYGPQGTGKSLTIAKTIQKYTQLDGTVVLYWPTDKLRASDVKVYLKYLKYSPECKRLIFIIEDIGGVSVDTEGSKLAVEPSLLSILDNMESIFKIPTMIIATTNFPENLLQNIANRPKRFDYLHKVDNPSDEFRAKFLEFFSQGSASEAEMQKIMHQKFAGFSVAHIEEVVIRHALEDTTLEQAMDDVLKQANYTVAGFKDPKSGVGIK